MISEHDVVLLSETWLSNTECLNLEIDGYSCDHIFGNKSVGTRKGRFSGGISIYYKNCYRDKIHIVEKHQCGIMWVKVQNDLFKFDEDVFICSLYIPPHSSKVLNSHDIDMYELLEQGVLRYRDQGKLFIAADFNARTGTESDLLNFDKYLDDEALYGSIDKNTITTRANKDSVSDTCGRRLLSFCQTTDLLIANGRFGEDRNLGQFTFVSHNGLSTVDYLLCNLADSQYISNFCILTLNEFSDHSPIYFSITSNYFPHNTLYVSTEDTFSQQKLIFNSDRVPIFRNQLLTYDCVLDQLTQQVNTGQIDTVVQSFTNYLYDSASSAFGKIWTGKGNRTHKRTTPKNPWFDEKCLNARNEFKRARNAFLKNKTDNNRHVFISMRTKFNKIKRKAKQTFKLKEGQQICDMANSNPKQFWKSIKKKMTTKSAQSDKLNVNDLFEHFKTIYGEEPEDTNPQMPVITEPQSHTDFDSEISENEIKTAIFSQNNNKSTGTDCLCAELFKESFDIISPFLLKLYNRLFSNGEYPRLWGEGIIVPIFKGGNPDDTGNYRGITLINIMGKIYSQILLNRLNKWAEKEEKILGNQFGFQKGKSTTDCIFTFHSIIAKTLSMGEKLYCIFIDYEKAFDKINRSLLWHKLLTEQVSSKFVNALRSMYNVVKSCVRYQSGMSRFFTSYNGLKQGDPSSPLLFMLFINDIVENVNAELDNMFTVDELRLFILLYADDAVVFAKSAEVLQSILNDIESYCTLWGLKINTRKTKAMIFEKGRHTHFDFYLNNVKLEMVTSFKYLGIHFFKNGNWHRTQKRLAQHASFALHKLFSLFGQVELTTSRKCKLFDILVGSVLNYGSEVWGLHEAKDIECLHTKFCRWILHVRKSTNLSGLYGELGRYPLIIFRKLNMIRYWIKLLLLNEHFIPKRVYTMLKHDVDNNRTYNGLNWAYQIKSILDNIGLSNIWIQQSEIEIPFNLIRQRVFDMYKQSWYSAINNSNRLEMYSRYKHDFDMEQYLDFIKDKKFKIAFTKFRLSSHDLAIESGRYENLNRNERICKYCNGNFIETEYHFLLVCTHYRELRQQYMKPYYGHWPTLNKFDELMSKRSKKNVLNIAKFIYFASVKRKNSLI